MLLLALACSTPQPAPQPTPAPVEAPVLAPRPAPITDPVAATALLAGPLEQGACRQGKVRVEGIVVLDGKDPQHVPLLTAALDGPTEAAALAAGVLWDARADVPADRGPKLVDTLVALLAAEALPGWRCRALKPLEPEGQLWDARGDVLALIARGLPEPARSEARAALVARLPEHADSLQAAFGDEDAIARLTTSTLAELCAGRTWATSWTLRAMDTGKAGASMPPLTAFENHQCPKGDP